MSTKRILVGLCVPTSQVQRLERLEAATGILHQEYVRLAISEYADRLRQSANAGNLARNDLEHTTIEGSWRLAAWPINWTAYDAVERVAHAISADTGQLIRVAIERKIGEEYARIGDQLEGMITARREADAREIERLLSLPGCGLSQ